MTDQCNVFLSVRFTTDMRPQKRQPVMEGKNAFAKQTNPTYATRKHTFQAVL